jgi:uncharacterized membrane protein YozB (DUF420 family)
MGRARWSSERVFYTGMAIAMFLAVYVGFARSFFLKPRFPEHAAPPETFFLFHGVAFAAWSVLLIVQASLVAGGRTDVHRKLGAWGAALAVAMVVLGIIGALIAANRPGGFVRIPVPPQQFLIIPFTAIVFFAVFVALAVAKRRDSQSHKRLMLLGTIAMLGAAFARWPGVENYGPPAFFALSDLFIVALAIWDFRSRGRLHPVTLWGGLASILAGPVSLVVMGTPGWQAFARWSMGLVA